MEITTEEEYEEAISEYEDLMALEPPVGSYEYDRINEIAQAIRVYEENISEY